MFSLPSSPWPAARRPAGAILAAPLFAAALLLPGADGAKAQVSSETCTEATANRLQITVAGVRTGKGGTAKGLMAITLYPDDESQFLARKGKIARVRIPATAPETRVCLPLPAPGAYAVAVYHDENSDHDFNRTLLGMPAEGYGFSNDADTTLGLPRFKDVRFNAGAGSTDLVIHLRY
ncbi:DUF2141 domain-containing protein [Oleisolibacter albus]|uniref:DUF2141 domain-containing protein n=1 Tax=Oleisolibacter albus TaxID=2171757 RepID=UPI00138FF4BD|nr:DUF2141 domain-containing protein [Oleisolibacter albus]